MKKTFVDVLVVGGGPAGLAAAVSARKCGVSVLVVDDREELGGQAYRHFAIDTGEGGGYSRQQSLARKRARSLIQSFFAAGSDLWQSSSVLDLSSSEAIVARSGAGIESVAFTCCVIATGAYDAPFPISGWTLPGVMAAGGASALFRQLGKPERLRVLLCGTGPLLITFAGELVDSGVQVAGVVERAPRPSSLMMPRVLEALSADWEGTVALMSTVARLRYKRVPIRWGAHLVSVEGEAGVRSATVCQHGDRGSGPGQLEEIKGVDIVCLGYGLTPSTELVRLAGAEVEPSSSTPGLIPVVTGDCRTSVPSIFVAGDCAVIRGAYGAERGGRLAGAMAGSEAATSKNFSVDHRHLPAAHQKAVRKARRLTDAVSVLYKNNSHEGCGRSGATLICRCEEVSCDQVIAVGMERGFDLAVIRSETRLGMGWCQGRNCIPTAVRELRGLETRRSIQLTQRPPARTVLVEQLTHGENDSKNRVVEDSNAEF